jgi:hypothetical protein
MQFDGMGLPKMVLFVMYVFKNVSMGVVEMKTFRKGIEKIVYNLEFDWSEL